MKYATASIVMMSAALSPVDVNAQPAMTGGPTPSPAGACVYFTDLKSGDTAGPKVAVRFGLKGMGVAPAGTEKAKTGHHHLIVDSDLPPLNETVPADEKHIHFGGGQTETEITLTPGPHTLQLLLADQNHVPHTPPVLSEQIKIVVADGATQSGQAVMRPANCK